MIFKCITHYRQVQTDGIKPSKNCVKLCVMNIQFLKEEIPQMARKVVTRISFLDDEKLWDKPRPTTSPFYNEQR